MNARRVAKELEVCTRGLNKAMASTPPSNNPEQVKQVELWKKYLNWEKSNPLRTEDQSLLTKRTMFAYEQCLLCLGHHPHVWYEAALFLQKSTKTLSDKGVCFCNNNSSSQQHFFKFGFDCRMWQQPRTWLKKCLISTKGQSMVLCLTMDYFILPTQITRKVGSNMTKPIRFTRNISYKAILIPLW